MSILKSQSRLRYAYINIDYRLKTCLQYPYTTINNIQIIRGSVLKVQKRVVFHKIFYIFYMFYFYIYIYIYIYYILYLFILLCILLFIYIYFIIYIYIYIYILIKCFKMKFKKTCKSILFFLQTGNLFETQFL